MQPIKTYEHVTLEVFINEIVISNRPALMKGLAADWKAVGLAKTSDEAVVDYLKGLDVGKPAEIFSGAPSIKGEFFYGDSLRNFNFRKGTGPISGAMEQILKLRTAVDPPSLYIQSTPIFEHLPGFIADNKIGFMPQDIAPRIWIGNALRVQTHYDLANNVAVLVAGKRRFTLFAPDQLPNLYVGPFENTLAGPPVSLASLENPDFERHPRFKEALATAVYADLEPGDAIYIPYAWWHHVRSFEAFNILVNYWWNDTRPHLGSPYDALLHGILALRDMPRAQRDVWKTMFDYYVFGQHGDPVAHIAPEDQGALGPMTPETYSRMSRQLIQGLMKSHGPK